ASNWTHGALSLCFHAVPAKPLRTFAGKALLRRGRGLVADRLHIRGLALLRLFRNLEDLAGPDHVRIPDLILVGEVDRGIADAEPIDAAGYVPQRIATTDNDRAVDAFELGGKRLRRRCGNLACALRYRGRS